MQLISFYLIYLALLQPGSPLRLCCVPVEELQPPCSAKTVNFRLETVKVRDWRCPVAFLTSPISLAGWLRFRGLWSRRDLSRQMLKSNSLIAADLTCLSVNCFKLKWCHQYEASTCCQLSQLAIKINTFWKKESCSAMDMIDSRFIQSSSQLQMLSLGSLPDGYVR